MGVYVLDVYTDSRTRDMVVGCQNAVMSEDMAAQVYCTQGSYSTAVGASGGTHSGGGALDFARFRRDGREWTWNELCSIAICLRQVGFAAWPRERIPGTWERHVHAEAIGCPDASAAAKAQWTDYSNHRDGLASNAADPLQHFDVTWEQFHAANPYCLEDIMASLSDLTSVLRSEGVSGAGDAPRMLSKVTSQLGQVVAGVLRSEGVSGAADAHYNGSEKVLAAIADVRTAVQGISDRVAVLEGGSPAQAVIQDAPPTH